MKAIPTVYKGIQFRSRLEAQWAAFFDLLEWAWEYEPFDLNGYIPDFALKHRLTEPLLVEVKPVLRSTDFDQFLPKIRASGWEHECLVVGATYFMGNFTNPSPKGAFELSQPCLGLLTRCQPSELNTYQDGWGVLYFCNHCKSYSLCSTSGLYCHREDHGLSGEGITFSEVSQMWSQAKNTVQWKGKS